MSVTCSSKLFLYFVLVRLILRSELVSFCLVAKKTEETVEN